MSKTLTVYNSDAFGHHAVCKTIIEREATSAAHKGQSLDDSCPYPFSSEAGVHFKAVYLLALPKAGQQSEGQTA